MSRSPLRTLLATTSAALAALVTLAGLSQPATAAPGGRPVPPPAGSTSAGPDRAVRTATAEADRWRLAERRADRAAGSALGGSFVAHGQMVTAVTTHQAAAAVRRVGGRAVLVDDSQARLDRIHADLDTWSRTHAVGSTQGWRVDLPTNSVVVTLTSGAHDPAAHAFAAHARRHGEAVRFEERAARVTGTASIYGGLEYRYNYRSDGTFNWCSVGFTAVDSVNRPVFLTAGHCLAGQSSVYRNGYTVGSVRSWRFGGQDWAVVNNSYPTYWRPYAYVSRWNGTSVAVRGLWNTPTVGTAVCKSGRTSHWTCGRITATNVTQAYNGRVMYGLVRHTACTEAGDSGGAVMSGAYAVGLTAAASHYTNAAGAEVCGQRLGYANESYYQPLGPALTASGMRLLYVP